MNMVTASIYRERGGAPVHAALTMNAFHCHRLRLTEDRLQGQRRISQARKPRARRRKVRSLEVELMVGIILLDIDIVLG